MYIDLGCLMEYSTEENRREQKRRWTDTAYTVICSQNSHVEGSSGFTEYCRVSCTVKRFLRLIYRKYIHDCIKIDGYTHVITFLAEMVSVLA